MSGLEHLLKGTKTGAASVLDFGGTAINLSDYALTGVGPASKRAIHTFSSHIHQKEYGDFKDKIPFFTGYVPRVIGETIGGAVSTAGLVGAYVLGGPIAALAVPAALGAYGAVRSGLKYIGDFVLGEKVDGKRKRASFTDGLNFGWHRTTYLGILPGLESDFTGRGYADSHLDNHITKSAKPMRRNLCSVTGNVVGGLVGAVLSVATLGILPIYKSLRDTISGPEKRSQKEPAPEAVPQPA